MSLTQASPFRWLDSWLPEFKSTRPHLQISNWIDQRQLKFSKMLCYIDGCVAYLVRASSSHKRALATTTATNVKKAKQLRKCRISFLCVHFLAINARLQREIPSLIRRFAWDVSFSIWLEVDPKDQLQNSSTIKKNCVIWNNPDKIWKSIHLCVFSLPLSSLLLETKKRVKPSRLRRTANASLYHVTKFLLCLSPTVHYFCT